MITMVEIGEPKRQIEVPEPLPAQEPEPEKVPERAPAEPEKVPV